MVKSPSLKEMKAALLRRVFFLSSLKRKGSMALEGALVLPVFLFFMMTMLLCLETVRFQSNVMEALHQAGNQKAVQEYLVKKGVTGENTEQNIRYYLKEQTDPYFCIKNKEQGISVQDLSTVSENGLIQIQVEYKINDVIAWLPIGEIIFKDQFYGHAFVGYTGNENTSCVPQEETYVYVTRTGSRYHLRANCTHLRISVKTVLFVEVAHSRNQSGEKYYPCERCHPGRQGSVYITGEGNRYHGQADCSSLKRDVYMIPLREAGAYTPCRKCLEREGQ